MNLVRKLVGFLMAFALASGVALGADKTYTLTMSPLTGTSPTAMTAIFLNKGNSSFNSLTLTVPAGYTLGATPTSSRGQVSVSGQVISVLNINLPTGSGQSVTVTMPVVSTSATCSSGVTGIWTAVVWTGSTLGGNNFAQVGPSTTSTTLGAQCYTVTSSSSGNGTISPNQALLVIAGTKPAFTLAPATGYKIDLVTGTCGGTLVGNTFTTNAVIASCSVVANFTKIIYKLTYTAGANGSISGTNPQFVPYLDSGTQVTAAGNDTYRFASWSDGVLTASRTDALVASSINVTANFVQNTLTITAPSNPGAGSPFPVTVTGDGPAVVSVTVSGQGCSLTPPTSAVAVPPNTFNVTIAQTLPPADQYGCVLKVSAIGYPDATFPFTKVSAGVLDCFDYDSSLGKTNLTLDPDPDKAYVIPNGSGWGLRRGPNKDGSACVKVNYSCSLDGTNNIASCTWDKTSGQQATFKYVFVWSAVTAGADGWKDYRPLISWGIPNPGAPALYNWMPALACVDDQFPTPPVLPTAILPTIPSLAPWTDTGNNSGQYVPSTSALVCVAQQGSTSAGVPPGPVLLQFWHKVIDEADVAIKGPSS